MSKFKSKPPVFVFIRKVSNTDVINFEYESFGKSARLLTIFKTPVLNSIFVFFQISFFLILFSLINNSSHVSKDLLANICINYKKSGDYKGVITKQLEKQFQIAIKY